MDPKVVPDTLRWPFVGASGAGPQLMAIGRNRKKQLQLCLYTAVLQLHNIQHKYKAYVVEWRSRKDRKEKHSLHGQQVFFLGIPIHTGFCTHGCCMRDTISYISHSPGITACSQMVELVRVSLTALH